MTILMLAELPEYSTNANALFDHIDAIRKYSKHKVLVYPKRGELPAWVDLEKFDAVVIHYVLPIYGENYVTKKTKDRLVQFQGLKALFLQDEFQTVIPINQEIKRLGISLIFSCMAEPVTSILYPKEQTGGAVVETVLTGYVPQKVPKRLPPLANREMTVSYRGRKLPYWYGAFAKDKWEIAEKFAIAAAGREDTRDWKIDLSYRENDRIYGDHWTNFLKQSRVTLGVESGTSMIDFDGGLRKRTEEFISENPDATFEAVEKNCFPGEDGKYFIKAISPRCFEAIATKTAMVLYEGEYSGILKPWIHYVPLKKDFSNFDEVANAINNLPLLQEMVERSFKEIIVSGRFGPPKLALAFDSGVARTKADTSWNINPFLTIKFYLGYSLDEYFAKRGPGYWKERFDMYCDVGMKSTCRFYGGRSYRIWREKLKIAYRSMKETPFLGFILRRVRDLILGR